MNKPQILALYDQDQRRTVEYPQMRREVTPNAIRHIDMSGNGEGIIIHSQLNEADAEETIRAQVSYFEGIGQGFEWKVYDYDTPSDLKERLRSNGFFVEEEEVILVLDLEEAHDILSQSPLHDVKRILGSDQLTDVLTIEQQVWDEDLSGLGDYLGEALRNYPAQMSVYVAYVDEQPASTAWIYFPEHSVFASLWGGSTVNDYRRQGLYTGLLAARAQEASARQVRYLTVDASVMSRPVLEKFGFEMIAYSYPCKWKHKSRTPCVTE